MLFRSLPLKMPIHFSNALHSDNSFFSLSRFRSRPKIALFCSFSLPSISFSRDIYMQVWTFLVVAVFLLSAQVQSKQAFALPLSYEFVHHVFQQVIMSIIDKTLWQGNFAGLNACPLSLFCNLLATFCSCFLKIWLQLRLIMAISIKIRLR